LRNRVAGLSLLAVACAHAGDGHCHGHGHGHEMPHRFDDPEKWAAEFEDPSRDAWQKPDEVVAALQLPPDAVVADIGAATGYFPVRLARALQTGKVYAVDLEPTMSEYLRQRAQREGLGNLHAITAAADDPKLPEPVDLVLVVDTYHHLEHRPAYFERLRAKLRPNARLVIIDFTKSSPMGPPEAMRLGPEQVREELERAGYVLSAEHGFLPHQYFLVFTSR
jgi:cyclopropane fatty-acyl-phospholipid synthase-like methyltransferase